MRSTLFLLLSTSLAGPASAQEFSYDYLGQPIPLELDATRVALRRTGLGSQDLGHVLGRQAGLAAVTSVEDWTVPGWTIARIDPGMANEEFVRRLVREIPRIAEFDFASPVFLDDQGPIVMTPELLVRTESHDEAFTSELGDVLAVDAFGIERLYRVSLDTTDGFEVLERANALADTPGVEYAEPHMFITGHAGYIPNDPRFGSQWALSQVSDFDMDAPEAWDITLGDANVWVAVLDSGVEQAHTDLTTVPGFDWTSTGTGGEPYNACDNHGTSVAGCIAMTVDNSLGGSGLSPNCPVISMKIFLESLNCDGSFLMLVSYPASALDYCRDNGIRVTNSSWTSGMSATISTAFDSARAAGVVNFAATGNDSASSIGYPSSLASVIAVTSVSQTGGLSSFSNTGSGLALSAPGAGIYSTDRSGSDGYTNANYVNTSGTSFASPYAAAVAALVLSVDGTLTADEVEDILEGSAGDLGTPGYDTTYGHGMVNAHRALIHASCLSTASSTVRNAGTNPNVYTASAPILGQPMQFDVATAPHNVATIIGYASPASVTLSGGQTLLVDLGSPKYFQISSLPGPNASVAVPLPANLAFCGATFSTQAVLLGGVKPFAATNAVDCVMGAP